MSDLYRVDHIVNGALRAAPPAWYDDKDAAEAEEARLKRSGCERAVAWLWGEGDE